MRLRRPGVRGAAKIGLACGISAAISIGFVSGALADDGYKTVTVKRPGLSLQVPTTWKSVHLSKKALAALEAKLATTNPGVALDGASQAALLQVTSFYAGSFDAAIAGQPLSFVTVQPKAVTVAPANLNEFSASTRAAFAERGWTVVDTTQTTYGGKPAYRVDFLVPDAAGGNTLIGELLVPDGRGGDEVVVTTTSDDAGKAVVDHVLGSVQRKH